MTTNIPAESLENQEKSLREQIDELSSDLMYPSESDEKIEYFEMEFSTEQKVALSDFRMFNGIRPEITISEITFEDFFAPLIKMEDWFGEEEKKWAEDSLKLKYLLSENVKDIEVLKVGSVEIDVYLFGRADECKWVGLKTKVIET